MQPSGSATDNPFVIIYVWRPSRLGVSEGLNVLLTELIKGLLNLGVPVRILTTGRHIDGLHDALRMNGVDNTAVDVQVLTAGSRAMSSGRDATPPRSRIAALLDMLRSWGVRREHFDRTVSWMLDRGILSFLSMLAIAFLAVLVALAATPFILVAAAVVLIRRVSQRIYARLKGPATRWFPRITARFRLLRDRLFGVDFSMRMQEQFYRRECLAFAKAVMRQPGIERMFFAAAFDGVLVEALKRRKTIVTFPDAVTAMFPSRYPSTPHTTALMSNIARSIRAASGVVCYSEYSRDTQLAPLLIGVKSPPKVTVIPQGFHVDTEIDQETANLNYYVRSYFPSLGEFPEHQFGSFQYVLYPSVDRPHKNALTLIRAVEHLLRKKYLPIKVVMTSPGPSADAQAYIARRKLHRDVIFMPGLPLKVLNRVLRTAALVVHPSLSEGGDIFNFSRAVSNDCPALLADIAVAHEMFGRHGISQARIAPWLFDPLDYIALAEKIEQVIARREEVLSAQSLVFRQVSRYRFEDMAQRYYEFYMSI